MKNKLKFLKNVKKLKKKLKFWDDEQVKCVTCCGNIDFDRHKRTVLAFVLSFRSAQLARFEHLTLDAGDVLATFAGARLK